MLIHRWRCSIRRDEGHGQTVLILSTTAEGTASACTLLKVLMAMDFLTAFAFFGEPTESLCEKQKWECEPHKQYMLRNGIVFDA